VESKILTLVKKWYGDPAKHTELRHYSLFKELSAYLLNLVQKHLHHREFKAGETIFEEGFPMEVIYFIASGEVQASGIHNSTDPTVLQKDQYIGVVDLFDQGMRLSTAKALTDVKLLALSQADFWELVNKNRALGIKLLAACCRFLGSYLLDIALKR
jgi:CRP/FNR family cyclic AMP-dependent transcriptional regulator